jgi:formate dehydrogenase subunit gamma
MKNKILAIMLLLSSTLLFGANDSAIWGKDMITDILGYHKEGSLHLGHYFTVLQSTYFKPLFLGVLLGVPGRQPISVAP